MSLKNVYLPQRYNYIAVFLTLDCKLKCGYCINSFNLDSSFNQPVISGDKWVEGLNRLICSKDLPVTLGGGEHGLHPQYKKEVLDSRRRCLDLGIDFRTKEFLGNLENILYGTYYRV